MPTKVSDHGPHEDRGNTLRPASTPPENSVDTGRQRKTSRTKSFKSKLKGIGSVLRLASFSIVPPPVSVGDGRVFASQSSPSGSERKPADCLLSGDKQQKSNGRVPEAELPGLVGLHNHGNTCFVNAVLQCVSNDEPLCKYFVLDQYRKDRKKMRGRQASELTTQLALLLKSMWTCQYDSLLSAHFRRLVANASSQYHAQCQQDAQEFFLWLLDQLHEDLAYRKSSATSVGLRRFGSGNAKVSRHSFHHSSNNKK